MFYVCGQAILAWSAVQLSKGLGMLLLLLETLSIFALKLEIWQLGDGFEFSFLSVSGLLVGSG